MAAGQLMSSWITYLDGSNADVNAFYSALEGRIAARKLPKTATRRFSMKEGGLLSASREYLKVEGDDLEYVICGAPFIGGFFVSARLFATGKFAEQLDKHWSNRGAVGQAVGLLASVISGTDTYFRFDTARVYLEVLQSLVTDSVNELLTQGGLQPLPKEQTRPVLQAFFQT